jgi:hypothetical protein
MTDQNQSSSSSSRNESEVQDSTSEARAYNDPRLGAKGFLLAVMHAPDLLIRDRMDAAARLLRLYGEESFAPPRFTHRIEGFDSDHHSSCPTARGSVFEHRGSSSDHPPEVDNRKSQSNLLSRSNNHPSHDGHPGPPNLTTNTDPPYLENIIVAGALASAALPREA